MWWIVIIIGIILSFTLYSLYQRGVMYDRLEDAIVDDFEYLCSAGKYHKVNENEIKLLTMKVYKLSFYRLGKNPYNFAQMRVDPQGLVEQAKYFGVYQVILGFLNSHINNKTESYSCREAIDAIVKSSIKSIKSIRNGGNL